MKEGGGLQGEIHTRVLFQVAVVHPPLPLAISKLGANSVFRVSAEKIARVKELCTSICEQCTDGPPRPHSMALVNAIHLTSGLIGDDISEWPRWLGAGCQHIIALYDAYSVDEDWWYYPAVEHFSFDQTIVWDGPGTVRRPGLENTAGFISDSFCLPDSIRTPQVFFIGVLHCVFLQSMAVSV